MVRLTSLGFIALIFLLAANCCLAEECAQDHPPDQRNTPVNCPLHCTTCHPAGCDSGKAVVVPEKKQSCPSVAVEFTAAAPRPEGIISLQAAEFALYPILHCLHPMPDSLRMLVSLSEAALAPPAWPL